jgi:N-acetylmuramic acid 6-phosphate etherase
MTFIKTTEQSSAYDYLEKMSVAELLSNINNEDITYKTVENQSTLQQELQDDWVF